MNKFPSISVVIPAGGGGVRFGGDTPKQFLPLEGVPVIIRAMSPFYAHHRCAKIAVAVHPNWLDWMNIQVNERLWDDKVEVTAGGAERGDSVYAGLKALPETDVVLIHDAVRPFVTEKMITETAAAAVKYGGAAAAIPLSDTLKREKDGFIENTVDRENLWRVQTPQAFRYREIIKAYEAAEKAGYKGTDDCVLTEKFAGTRIKLVMGSESNIKITLPEDLEMAKKLVIGH